MSARVELGGATGRTDGHGHGSVGGIVDGRVQDEPARIREI